MRWPYVLLILWVLLSCDKAEEAWKANLGNPSAEVRMATLKQLMEKGGLNDLEYLALAARDLEPGVRMVAAEGLGRSRDRHALDLLGGLLMDVDEKVQVAAAQAMGHSSSERARKYLLLRFPQSRQLMRHAIVQALRASGLAEPMKQAVSFEAKELWEKAQKELAAPPSLAEWVSAIARLGESGRNEAVELLLPLLREKTPVVVAAAAEGLANLGEHAVFPELEALALSSNVEIRKAGIVAMAALQAPHSIPLLIRLTRAEEEVALLAVEGLAGFSSSPEVDKAICELALQPGNRPVRIRAATALVQRAPCSPRPLFEQLLNASLAQTALLVLMGWPDVWSNEADKVWALTKSPKLVLSTLAARLLLQAYLREEGQGKYPVWRVAFLLERIGFLAKKEERWTKSPQGSGAGVRILFSEPVEDLSGEEGEQLAAFLSLASFLKPKAAEPYLKRYASASNISLRAAALAGLVRVGVEYWDIAEQGIFDKREEVRLAVAEAFVREGVEGERRLLVALGKRLEDNTALLGVLSCKQLNEEGAQVLMDFLDKGTQEAGVAARCLGRARHTEATGGLLLLLNSTVLAQKKAALEALREMGAEVMVAEVEKQLLHETPEIRQAAAGVLRHLRGGEEGEAMEALREDYYKRVRHGVGNI